MNKVLRFTAIWCGPCKMLSESLSRIETTVPIEAIDIDKHPVLAAKYAVRSVPTMVMVDENGNAIKTLTGNQTAEVLRKWLND
jgi:thioredoxin-like negative regulator of GroEL